MTKKKVLIYGASGFIGRNLFEGLSENKDLDVYGTYLANKELNADPPRSHLWRADLTDRYTARRLTEGFDIVINAAAVTDGSGAIAKNPAGYVADNMLINSNLIEAAHLNKIGQFIFLSCSIVYPKHNLKPVDELSVHEREIEPAYRIWAKLKLFGEELCRFYSDLGQTRFTVLRHSNIYGPYDKFDLARGHVFAATIAKVMSTADTVTVWGDGSEKRDFLHVQDFVTAVRLVMEKSLTNYEVFNIGSGTLLSIKELVDKINNISGRNIPVIYDVARQSIDTTIALDTSLARNVLGWQPHIDIDYGIRQTIDWYQNMQINKTKGAQW